MHTPAGGIGARNFRGVRALRWSLSAAVAAVWVFHGLYNKLLGGSPRHLEIIQSLPGFAGKTGEIVLVVVGVSEVLIAAWVLSGRWPRLCAGVQTAALLAMNILELSFAREHLLWPAGLLPGNILFLALAWFVAELHLLARPRAGRSTSLLLRIKRHPIPIAAHFRYSLVLTYALPARTLEPLLPPGLELDTYNGHGFVAIAMVQTESLRPRGLPRAVGQNFFLAGYRIFTRFANGEHTMRGLRILRSNADKLRMVLGGNLLTHYYYHRCRVRAAERARELEIEIHTPHAAADLHVIADLSVGDADSESPPGEPLPPGSIFATPRDARRFAGPLPWTFDYEPQTHSIIAVKGVRKNWRPRLVPVQVLRNTFFDQEPFRSASPVLASAFYVAGIDYRWERGVRFPLDEIAT